MNNLSAKPRKRKITRRLSEVSKKLRLSPHGVEKYCKYSRLKCFETIKKTERDK